MAADVTIRRSTMAEGLRVATRNLTGRLTFDHLHSLRGELLAEGMAQAAEAGAC